MGLRALHCLTVVAGGTDGNLLSRHFFLSLEAAHAGSDKFYIVLRFAQHLSAQLAHLLLQAGAGFFYCLTRYISRTGCVRSGIIRGSVGVCTEYRDVVHITFQTLRRHLRQNRIAARAHVCCTDHQRVSAALFQLDRGGTDIQSGNTGALHRHCDTGCTYFAIAHISRLAALVPMEQLLGVIHAAIQRTAGCHFIIISGHSLPFVYHVLFPDRDCIHTKATCQLIDCRFHREQSLRCTVSTISTRRLHICVNHIVGKSECFQIAGI